jgi:hypothetical protein
MPEVTKRKVTMTNYFGLPNGEVGKNEVVDYVRPDFLDAYVAAAQANWQSVVVSEKPDAGPGGYEGQTFVPENLDHELAGQTFAAEGKKK